MVVFCGCYCSYLNQQGDPDEHHIVRLYDHFYHKEHLFITTELLKDNLYDFQQFLASQSGAAPFFDLSRLQSIARQVLQALAYVHGNGVIHADVKPENILIKSFSRCDVKLIDFGSSCLTSDKPGHYIQSRSYRAPECVLGCTIGPKIDIWSLGCVLYELYQGRVLFENDAVQCLLARIRAWIGTCPAWGSYCQMAKTALSSSRAAMLVGDGRERERER